MKTLSEMTVQDAHAKVKEIAKDIDVVLGRHLTEVPPEIRWLIGSRALNMIWAAWYRPTIETVFDSEAARIAPPALDAAGKEKRNEKV